MTEKLYLECTGGIAGDMVVAALLDLGASEARLRKALASLPLDGYKIAISRVNKAGIDACDFDVVLAEDNYDHDMAYLYGESDQTHAHHHHDKANNHHAHRHLKEIRDIIAAGDLTDGAKTLANRIFDILAAAEGKAHNLPPEAVHFHEVGAVDAIVDVVAAAVCLDDLGITQAVISPLAEGQGTVRCQHGILPVPVPAVANIVAANDLALTITNRRGEWVTPTGAAIAAALHDGSPLPEAFRIKKIGIGAGKRDYPGGANILRAMCIETAGSSKADTIVRLESNIDDATGEMLGHVLEKLFEFGARDAFFVPIIMKKNRPATMLVVIADEAHRQTLEDIIFRETTTIGIRRVTMNRTILSRRTDKVRTPLGSVKVKRVDLDDGSTRLYPEYDSVVSLCETSALPYPQVLSIVLAACQAKND